MVHPIRYLIIIEKIRCTRFAEAMHVPHASSTRVTIFVNRAKGVYTGMVIASEDVAITS